MKPSARRVLLELRAAGGRGATTADLCVPEVGGARFGARILELRQLGCVIENVRERQGSDRYWLRSSPSGLLPQPAPPAPRPGPASPCPPAGPTGQQLDLLESAA